MPANSTTGTFITAAIYDADVGRLGAIVSNTFNGSRSTAGTTFGAGIDMLTSALSFTADGTSSYLIRVIAPWWSNTTATAVNQLRVNLDGADTGIFAQFTAATASAAGHVNAAGVFTTTAGVHTLNARLTVGSGTGSVNAGGTVPPILVAVAVI